ncbi:hypothetical protein [Priestia megaterium]|uniref:hypothetical protein n=1 Tax=Priestia megaterium TaxID=1404 RepID=UPI003C130166
MEVLLKKSRNEILTQYIHTMENDERIFGRPFFGRPFGFGFGGPFIGGLLARSLLSPYGYGGYC